VTANDSDARTAGAPMIKAFLYLASVTAVLAPAGGAPNPDAAQRAFCGQVTAYAKAVGAVANLHSGSSVAAIRKAQSDLRDAYASLERHATLRVTATQPAAQRLIALLDVSPASAGLRQPALACVPGSAETTHLQRAPVEYRLKYTGSVQCGPHDGLAEVETRSPMWVLGPRSLDFNVLG
jgi:hypothetical protein